MLKHLFAHSPDPYAAPVRSLYEAAVDQARQPAFYAELGVPDTLDGRFELITLHVFVILHRLTDDRARTEAFAQALFDHMFNDMDSALREMGAGDLGVGPRVKKMAQGFYGRVAAYDAGLSAQDGDLREAVRRNLFGTVSDPEPAAVDAATAYLRQASAELQRQDLDALMAGQVAFPPPPATQETQAN